MIPAPAAQEKSINSVAAGRSVPVERRIVIKEDILNALKKAGVRAGQVIMVHTSLKSLGFVCGG